MQYIYLFEGLEIKVSLEGPRADDAENDILTVLKISDNKVFDLESDGSWSVVPYE